MLEFAIIVAAGFMIGAVAGSIYYGEPITAVFDGIWERE